MADRNRTALVAGALFVVLGVLFLLDRLDLIRLGASFVLPLLLIGLGAGILLGGRSGARGTDRGEEPPAGEEEDEPSPRAPGSPNEDRGDEDHR